MSLTYLAVKNILRNRFRTFATISGVAVTILAFLLLRTLLWAWGAAVEAGAKDRIGTRHKVTFVMTIPKRYADEIREVPGVQSATWMNWFGGKYMKAENEFFGKFAVDPKTYLDVYDEVVVPPEQKDAWLNDRQGAMVGDVLANKMGWKIGDTVNITGDIFPGDWIFHISGIYTATRKSVDRSSFVFHWQYLNDSVPETRKDQIGWVVARIADASQSAQISAAIDKKFDDRDTQTLSMSETAMNASFMGMLSGILTAVGWVSIVIMGIMMLILGNTIAMGVRERTNEYGVMRALGFMPGHIAFAIMGEAATVGLLGGLLGLAIAFPVVNGVIGAWLTENMGAWFPYFTVQPGTAVLALGLALILGLLAAALPAYRASQLDVVTALRRVG